MSENTIDPGQAEADREDLQEEQRGKGYDEDEGERGESVGGEQGDD